MKTIRKFIRPISGMMASIILFMSCEQYDQDLNLQEQVFEYNTFSKYQSSTDIQIILQSIKDKLKSNSEAYHTNKQILESVNREQGTNIDLPEEFLHISLEMEAWEIYDQSLKKDWLTQREVSLYEEFSANIEDKGLASAIKDYENKVLSLNLPNEEFAKHNAFLNIIKAVDYEYPSVFVIDSQGRSPWRCALALVAMTAAIASVTSCVTVAACVVASALIINAGYAVADHCGGPTDSDSFVDA